MVIVAGKNKSLLFGIRAIMAVRCRWVGTYWVVGRGWVAGRRQAGGWWIVGGNCPLYNVPFSEKLGVI